MTISKEAIEAGAKALAERNGSSRWESFTGISEAVLEAALPFLPIAGDGKVKALEWRDGYRDSNVKIQQASSERLYQVREFAGVIWLDVGNEQTIYPSVEAAKAAAQSDYEARVLSALSPSSPGKDGGQEVEAEEEPVLFVSEKQLPNCIGTYLPTRKHREGNFQMPLYARPQPASTALVDRLTKALNDMLYAPNQIEAREKALVALSASQSTSREHQP